MCQLVMSRSQEEHMTIVLCLEMIDFDLLDSLLKIAKSQRHSFRQSWNSWTDAWSLLVLNDTVDANHRTTSHNEVIVRSCGDFCIQKKRTVGRKSA